MRRWEANKVPPSPPNILATGSKNNAMKMSIEQFKNDVMRSWTHNNFDKRIYKCHQGGLTAHNVQRI